MNIRASNSGFTIFELVITTVIIGIMFATGSVLITESTKNYYAEKELSVGLTKINTTLSRLSNYISPLIKNMHLPLYLHASKNEIIFSIANTAFGQAIEDSNVYTSQLVKIKFDTSSIELTRYIPDSIVNDTKYSSAADFVTITNGAAAIENKTTIANNITGMVIDYYDINESTTTDINSISNIVIDVTVTTNNTTRERSIIISPWRLLQ